MRLGQLSRETPEVAEVFCPGRFAASCSLFDMLLEVVLDMRIGWSLNAVARRATESDGRDRQLTSVVGICGEAFEQKGLRIWLHERVPLAV